MEEIYILQYKRRAIKDELKFHKPGSAQYVNYKDALEALDEQINKIPPDLTRLQIL